MTFVGKVLVVLQLILSVCFMAFAGAVFTAQTNWKNKHQTAQAELDKSKLDFKTKEENLLREKTELTTERDREKERATVAEGKADASEKDLTEERNKNKALDAEKSSLTAQSKVAGEEASQRREEARLQREENKTLHENRDSLLVQVRQLEDKLFAAQVKQRTDNEKHNRALDRIAMLEKILQVAGIDADPKAVAGKEAPPPIVEGVVLNTKRSDKDNTELIEISLGSDDGLLKGHEVFVFRTEGRGKFLGKIRLVYVTPDRAVGTVVEKAKNGVIQKGDNVASKL